jgi:hypothetical protein
MAPNAIVISDDLIEVLWASVAVAVEELAYDFLGAQLSAYCLFLLTG